MRNRTVGINIRVTENEKKKPAKPRNSRPYGLFDVVEISGIEPLTS